MNGNVGIWIDHRHAVIVRLTDDTATIRHVLSHVEPHVRFSSNTQDMAPEDQRDRRFIGHLDTYYDKVVACVRAADAILIMGPGEAKGELPARLERASLGGRIVGSKAADKMTERQIVAAVKRHFGSVHAAAGSAVSRTVERTPLYQEG